MQPGDCAVECPACPHPERNLPEGWEDVPEYIRWLYILIITIDANFRLKLKEKGILNDPALRDGWAHWTRSQPYGAYIAKYGHQVEPNLCDSELKAVNHS
ncbi:hypothetical protein PILCRDRAFT_14111 [Piloderma croceum F 1598]|uniref:Uncharacterized protein n=1 Tax=Piloderma croceum (strain F 1598) TaxID=765440 RepID=A0A0C3BBU9_PILCF|nr:hypothetical protein PILCRDRAFT_14111 [Piloderma croceum F 1598]